MANNVNIPAQGTGDTTPKVSTDQVSADSSQVQNVQLTTVSGGVLTRNPTVPVSVASVPSHPVTNAGTFAVQADTELPAAAALGDSDANPTTPQVGSALQGWSGTVWVRLKAGIGDAASATGLLNLVPMMFNGTTYDRLRGDATNGLKVNGSGVTQPVSGTVTTSPPSNASTNIAQVAGATISQGHGTAASAIRVELPTDGTGTVVLAAGAATIGALTANQTVNQAQVAGTAVDTNSGNKSAGTQRVVIATDQVQLTNALKVDASATTQPVSQANPVQAATATLANVAGSATSVTLQASNAARKGLVIVNDSTAILYVKFGTTASTTSYTYFLAGSVGGVPATLELPAMTYTGRVDGIWASAVGNARVTEMT